MNKDNYQERQQDFVLDPESDESLALKLSLEVKPDEVDLFKLLDLQPIYFDYD